MSDLCELDPTELSDSYEVVDENGDVKAKMWEADDGQRRVYVRMRRHDDGRRFDEFWIPVGDCVTADGAQEEPADGESGVLAMDERVDEYLEKFAESHHEATVRQREFILKDFVEWYRSEDSQDEPDQRPQGGATEQ